MKKRLKLLPVFFQLQKYWDLFIFILATYCAIEVPLWMLFQFKIEGWILYLEIFISLVFLINLILGFRASFYKNGYLITEPKEIFKNYITSWFILDFLSIIPYEILFEKGLIPQSFLFLSLFRFLRVIKLVDIENFKLNWGIQEFINTSSLRLIFLIYWILLFAHWTACGWIELGGGEQNADMQRQYIRAFYWAITTLATIGYGDITPTTNIQTIYTVSIMLIGAGVYGYVVGNIASILSSTDMIKSQFIEKMQKIQTFMKYKKLPRDLQSSILDYYDYIWKNRKGFNEDVILEELPPALKERVSIYLNKPLVKKVPLLKEASDAMITRIVMNLRPIVYMKGDYIFRKGDKGDNLYIISKGIVEIVSEDESNVYSTLTEGSFFGEIALIKDITRTATARAASFCDLYYLEKTTFELLLKGYPDFAKHVRKVSRVRFKKK